MAENHLQKKLTELNERLSHLQTRNDPADSEEFVRLYQERNRILKQIDPKAAEVSR